MAKKLGGFDALFQNKPIPQKENNNEEISVDQTSDNTNNIQQEHIQQPEYSQTTPPSVQNAPQQAAPVQQAVQTQHFQVQQPATPVQNQPIETYSTQYQHVEPQVQQIPVTQMQPQVQQQPELQSQVQMQGQQPQAPVQKEKSPEDLSIVRTFRVKKTTALALKITAAKHDLKMGEMIDDAVAFYLANHPELH